MISIHQLLNECIDRDFHQRIDLISTSFLGTPYLPNPVGEGKEDCIDSRTPYRVDNFDCQTFIETVICLSGAKNEYEFRELIKTIRYGGEVSFFSRHHFLFKQWIPMNLAKMVIKDLNRQLVCNRFPLVDIDTSDNFNSLLEKYLNSAVEFKSHILKLKEIATISEPTNEVLLAIPFYSLFKNSPERSSPRRPNLEIIQSIPNYSLVAFYGINMQHIGIAIWKKGVLWIRHASKIRTVVVEESFERYLLYLAVLSSCTAISFYSIEISLLRKGLE